MCNSQYFIFKNFKNGLTPNKIMCTGCTWQCIIFLKVYMINFNALSSVCDAFLRPQYLHILSWSRYDLSIPLAQTLWTPLPLLPPWSNGTIRASHWEPVAVKQDWSWKWREPCDASRDAGERGKTGRWEGRRKTVTLTDGATRGDSAIKEHQGKEGHYEEDGGENAQGLHS